MMLVSRLHVTRTTALTILGVSCRYEMCVQYAVAEGSAPSTMSAPRGSAIAAAFEGMFGGRFHTNGDETTCLSQRDSLMSEGVVEFQTMASTRSRSDQRIASAVAVAIDLALALPTTAAFCIATTPAA